MGTDPFFIKYGVCPQTKLRHYLIIYLSYRQGTIMGHVPIIHMAFFLLLYLTMPETEFTPQNLSEKTLRYGYWFVTHKILLKRIGIGKNIIILKRPVNKKGD